MIWKDIPSFCSCHSFFFQVSSGVFCRRRVTDSALDNLALVSLLLPLAAVVGGVGLSWALLQNLTLLAHVATLVDGDLFRVVDCILTEVYP